MSLFVSAPKEQQRAPLALLTPQNCISSSRIRAFLRLSRIAADDGIQNHLNEIPKSQCLAYFERNIVPQWAARAEAIEYCAEYARHLRKDAEDVKLAAAEQQDLRINPYAAKDSLEAAEVRYAQCLAIENWVANESSVDAIIREQTANVLSDKCYYSDWLAQFQKAMKRS